MDEDDGNWTQPSEIEEDALDEALARWQRRDLPGALYYLEIALGKNWAGLSEILNRR